MKAAVLRFRPTGNPRERADRCDGWRPWIIGNVGEPVPGLIAIDELLPGRLVRRVVTDVRQQAGVSLRALGPHRQRPRDPAGVRPTSPRRAPPAVGLPFWRGSGNGT